MGKDGPNDGREATRGEREGGKHPCRLEHTAHSMFVFRRHATVTHASAPTHATGDRDAMSRRRRPVPTRRGSKSLSLPRNHAKHRHASIISNTCCTPQLPTQHLLPPLAMLKAPHVQYTFFDLCNSEFPTDLEPTIAQDLVPIQPSLGPWPLLIIP